MQTVNEWKKGINNSNTGSNTLQSVSDWKKTVTLTQPTPDTQPQPDLLDKLKTSIANYAKESAGTVDTLGNAILNPIDTIKKLPGVFTKPFKAGIKKASTPVKVGNIVTDAANLFTGVAESLFSPITGAFKIAENIPGAKQVADVISLPFVALGTGASFTIGKVIDSIPDNVLSKETKDVIKQPLQEAGATASQVALGGKTLDIIGQKIKSGEKITPDVAKEAIDQAKTEVKTSPKKKVAQETTTPTNTAVKPLSVAEWKAQGKPATAPVRPVEATKPATALKTKQPKKQDITFKSTEGVSGLAKSVKSKAIKDKMIFAFDKRFRNLPEFEKRIKSEDIKKATEITLNDPQGAFEIAMGNKKPPAGVLPEDIFVAVNELATQTKNVDVLVKLANESKLTGEATLMGQRIQALSQLNPDAPATRLKNIKKARQDKVKNFDKRKGNITKTIKENTKKNNLSKAELNWDKFLKEITC